MGARRARRLRSRRPLTSRYHSRVALASLADVKRILRLTDDDTVRDASLRVALLAVESWASTRLKKMPPPGSQVEVYWDIREDATLHLPTDDLVVTKVNVFEYPSSSGIVLSPLDLGLGYGYEVTDDGKLFLRPVLSVTPFEGAVGQRLLRTYARVEVHYQATGVVPRGVSEGVAILAAGYYSEGPQLMRGLTSERIGDYSYSLAEVKPGDQASYITRALWFLGPFLRRNKVSVV